MKKVILLFVILIKTSSFSQNKPSIDYFDNKGKKTSYKKSFYLEETTKIGESLWEIKRYRKNGKLFNTRFSTTKNKKKLIGQTVNYGFNDSIVSVTFFNKQGEKHGRALAWFEDSRSKSVEGIFKENKKEGIWKYYHSNGKLAARKIFKNDSVVRGVYFDELGSEISHNLKLCDKKAIFKKGKQKFANQLQYIGDKLPSLQGKRIRVNFKVDVNGNIKHVNTDELLPTKETNIIVEYFEKIKGWSPAIVNHRRVDTYKNITLKFNKRK